jgi:sugar phosphate isomerase/epimerase
METPMNLCAPTWAWESRLPEDQHLSIPEALHHIAALGISYAEFWIWQREDLARYTAEHRADIRSAMAATGVQLVALDLHPYGMLSNDDEARDGAWAYTRRCIDVATDLGVEVITTITTAVPLDVAYRVAWCRTVSFLRNAVGYAATQGIVLCLEPEPGTITANGDSFLRIVEEVPGLRANVDIGHHHLVREQPWTVVEKIGADVAHVHLGDNDATGDHSWAPGRGTIGRDGFTAFLKALHQVGYRGYHALDIHPAAAPDETVAASVSYLRALGLQWHVSPQPSARQCE